MAGEILAPIAEEEEATVGPTLPKAKRRKVLEFEAAHLDALPSAQMYECSYMHRDSVSHVEVATASDFVITASVDGHIKFWKKRQEGVEFAKHFRAHLGPVAGLAVSHDGSFAVSFSTDKSLKVFDIRTLDMMAMLRLPFVPSCAEWIYKVGDAKTRLAVADRNGTNIHVYDIRSGSNDPLETFKAGHAPVIAMRYSPVHDVVISADAKGVIDYWSAMSYRFPSEAVTFEYRMETDLYALAKAKAIALSLAISKDGSQFAAFCSDRRVRVFWFAKGKLRRTYDESLQAAQELQLSDGPFRLEAIDFGRRMAVEKEMEADPDAPQSNAVFDDSGNFILYPTMLGIKVVNLVTNRVARIIGKVENTERFVRIALYQGNAARKAGAVARLPGGADSKLVPGDPTVVAAAFQRQRFYLFTKREPTDSEDAAAGRDVFNEKPNAELLQVGGGGEDGDDADALPRGAILHTARGDIHLKLFPDECPRTVENFTTHARNGFYDNVIFHRVIKGFCIQTGDPLGDGTGGQSIWGGEFNDEISRNLRHDRPFTLSMANAGPNTNGSQFFITTVPTPWLDGKHTVFGRVVKGADVVVNIEKAKTNPKDDKPYEDIKIINIEVRSTVE